jgi:hypothetical protein
MMLFPLLKSRWVRITSVTVILCLVVLLGTPFLARYLAQQWLLENGGEQVLFEDVDLNFFTGNLELRGLEVKVDNETTLLFDYVGLDLDWWPLLHRQVDVQSLQLKGLYLVIDNRQPEAARVGGIRLPEPGADSQPPAKEPSAWLSGIETLTLQDFHILIRDSRFELDVALEYLRLNRMAQWTPEKAAVLEFAGRINDAPVQLSGELAPFAEQPRFDLDLSVEKLQVGAFRKLASPPIDELSGLWSYAGKLTFEHTGSALKLNHTGKTRIESLQVGLAEAGLETSIGQFAHDGKLAFEQSGTELRLDESGEIVAETLRLAMREAGMETSIDQFSINGDLAFAQSESARELSQTGKTVLGSLRVVLGEAGLETSIGQFAFAQSESARELSQTGKTVLGSLRVVLGEAGLETSIGQFAHDGKLAFEQSGTELRLDESGEIVAETLRLAMREGGMETSIDQFSINGDLTFAQSESARELSQTGKTARSSRCAWCWLKPDWKPRSGSLPTTASWHSNSQEPTSAWTRAVKSRLKHCAWRCARREWKPRSGSFLIAASWHSNSRVRGFRWTRKEL